MRVSICELVCRFGSTEQQFDVAAQMIDAVRGDRCSARCFGEDEGALEDGLGVQRERFRQSGAMFRSCSAASISASSVAA